MNLYQNSYSFRFSIIIVAIMSLEEVYAYLIPLNLNLIISSGDC